MTHETNINIISKGFLRNFYDPRKVYKVEDEADYLILADAKRVGVLLVQLDRLGLEYKQFVFSDDPNKVIVTVYFTDKLLDKFA